MNLQRIPSRRWLIVAAVSLPLIAFYVTFMLIIAFNHSAAATLVVPGVTLRFVCFTACSHAGLINVLTHARNRFPGVAIYGY